MTIIPIDRSDEQITAGRAALAIVRDTIATLRVAVSISPDHRASPGYHMATLHAVLIIQPQLPILDRYLTDRTDETAPDLRETDRILTGLRDGCEISVQLSDGGQSQLWLGSPFDETQPLVRVDANSAQKVRDRWLGIVATRREA